MFCFFNGERGPPLHAERVKKMGDKFQRWKFLLKTTAQGVCSRSCSFSHTHTKLYTDIQPFAIWFLPAETNHPGKRFRVILSLSPITSQVTGGFSFLFSANKSHLQSHNIKSNWWLIEFYEPTFCSVFVVLSLFVDVFLVSFSKPLFAISHWIEHLMLSHASNRTATQKKIK